MSPRRCRLWGWTLWLCWAASPSWGQSHHGSHGYHQGGGQGPVSVVAPPGVAIAAVGGGYTSWPFYGGIGLGGVPFSYVPPLILFAPTGLSPVMGPLVAPIPGPSSSGPLAGPWPPPAGALPPAGKGAGAGPAEPPKARWADATRAMQLVTYGDRHFRAGDLRHASERYSQAMVADPGLAAPRIRLAQVALVRGQYAEAAERYREAMVAEPGWLTTAPDIQTLYGEPADFALQIARLESHLQGQPTDREAWFVLGAQWYLSGQTRKAADVFLRLSDRRGDTTLAAFLDASSSHPPTPPPVR
jgi:thioredoxin-like negative regulator of GroEL